MSHFEPPAISKPVISTVVVPRFLYEATVRQNISLMNLTVFSELRRVASLEDIAVFAYLNDTLSIGGSLISTGTLKDVMSLGSGNEKEMNAVLGYMSETEEVRNLALNYIEPSPAAMDKLLAGKVTQTRVTDIRDNSMKSSRDSEQLGQGDLTYQLKTSGSNVFVVVDSGFSKYVGPSIGKEEPLTFVSDFLKLCTDQFSATEVARHPLFKTFLYSLAG